MGIPVVIGALGTAPLGMVKALEDLEIKEQVKIIQSTELSRSSRILGNVLETWRDLISLKLYLPSLLWQLNTPTATLQRGKTSPNECPRYYTQQSDDEVPVMLKLLGVQSTTSLPSLPGPIRIGVVAPDMVLSMG